MAKKIRTICALCVAVGLLGGCTIINEKRHRGMAVELDGHWLSYATLDSLTANLSAEDSAAVAERYVRQWANDILFSKAAQDGMDKQIEEMVADYRRSLYVHKYESELVARRMPKTVEDSVAEQLYAQNADRFRLKVSIVKGLLLVVPNGTPNIEKKLYKWLDDLSSENLEHIEKYAYQYATVYELFTDRWQSAEQLQLYLPTETSELNRLLGQQKRIVLGDSVSTYILQVTDKYMAGERMPFDFARPEIEKNILSRRQVDFLRRERENLYDEAVKKKQIHFYEK